MKLQQRSLVQVANDEISIIGVARMLGCHVGDVIDVKSVKVHCPFGFLHPDGGMETAFRIYPGTNSAYCVDYDTQILSRRGWLCGDKVNVGEDVLTYSGGVTRWEPVLARVQLPEAPRRLLSLESSTHSSLTTEDHRWMVERLRGAPRRYVEEFTTSGQGFSWSDRVPYGGPCVTLPLEPKWSDAYVELIAWFMTEGSVSVSGGVPAQVSIYQSWRVNPSYCARIRAVLTSLLGPSREQLRTRDAAWRECVLDSGKTEFRLSVAASRPLLKTAPEKVVDSRFISQCTQGQLKLFVETCLDGDGARVGTWRQLCQTDSRRLDSVQMAAALLGQPVNVWRRSSGDYAGQFLNSRGFRPARREQLWVPSDQPVWCVRTPSGTWLARRRGSVYVTGNCFAGCGYFSPVGLAALAWDTSSTHAAERLMHEAGLGVAKVDGWIPPATPQPDRDSLSEALRVYCSRTPGWASRQYQPTVSERLQRCLALLPRVTNAQTAEDWLVVCKQVMSRVLTSPAPTKEPQQ